MFQETVAISPSSTKNDSLLSENDVDLPARLQKVKRGYTTRHVPLAQAVRLLDDHTIAPAAGDVVLAEVVRVGKHAALEGPDSRRSALFAGDEILVAYGARYAPDQFEARVPDSLIPCHLAAGGGVAALVTARHAGVAAPTEIRPIGLLGRSDGTRINLADHARCGPAPNPHGRRPLTIASLGTSMNSGKTTSAAYFIRGLTAAGIRVGAAKITGTGSGNDPGLLRDAGALMVLDFTDVGYASTAGLRLSALVDVLARIQAAMSAQKFDVLVVEVADGLLQRETALLVGSPLFAQRVDGCLFSSGEAMGAVAGVRWLREHDLHVLALSGTLTRSPLARAEAEAATGVKTLGLSDLADPKCARGLVARTAAVAFGWPVA